MSEPLRLHQGEPSRTAEGAAARRAAHQLVDVPRVFDDPLAVRFLGAEGERRLRDNLAAQDQPAARSMRARMAGRSRYAEDRFAAGIARGVRQIIVLGAGLDTYAWRQTRADVRVFEVDHPATQAWKRARLSEIGVAPAACLTFAPVDFESQTLAAGLAAAGFDAASPAICSWLGVTVYLTEDAVFDTLRWAASLREGSEIVFDFGARTTEPERDPALRAELRRVAERVSAIGEPWRTFFAPDELAAKLRGLGFGDVEIVPPAEIDARYFEPLGSSLRMRGYLARAAV